MSALAVVVIILIVGGAFFIFILMRSSTTSQTNGVIQKETKNAESRNMQPNLSGLVRYNCELSAGTFEGGRCICPIEVELGQTQETQYDKNTGFCQSTIGGPAGDAANASSGLPYGDYSFWTGIILNLCTDSGGNISGVACICPSDKVYNKFNGKCE